MRAPRVVALGLVLRPADGHLLVQPGVDQSKSRPFHRLIGGGVEFGERAAEALSREFQEEYGIELSVGRRVAVIENHFTFESRAGHEIVLVFAGAPVDRDVFAAASIAPREEGVPPAEWRSPACPTPLLPAEVACLHARAGRSGAA